MSLEWGTIVKSINWTLVFNLINFALLLWILKKLLFKPAIAYLDKRRELIAGRMAEARDAEARAQETERAIRETLEQTHDRTQTMIDDARKRSEEIVSEAKKKAQVEAKQVVADARLNMEQERDRMIRDLREAYAEVAILGAERVLDREIRVEDHRRLLDQLLEEIDEESLRISP